MSEKLHPEEIVTSIIFVRHGHTMQTEQGKLYNDHRALLTERGKAQAAALAFWLGKESPELLLSSTADRVTGTAETIAAALGLPIQLLPGLDEQSVGEWEGRSYLEIKKSEPDVYKKWCEDPIRNRAPGGESILDVFERVKRDIGNLILENQGKKIVLVTHAGVLRSALVDALGMPIDNFWRLAVPTGSVSKIDYSANFATLQFMSLRLE